jgi:hypothetical protein
MHVPVSLFTSGEKYLNFSNRAFISVNIIGCLVRENEFIAEVKQK